MEKKTKHIRCKPDSQYPQNSYQAGKPIMSSGYPFHVNRTGKRKSPFNNLCCCFMNNNTHHHNFSRIDSVASSNGSVLHNDPTSSIKYCWKQNARQKNAVCGPFSWFHLPILISITSIIGFIATYFFAKNNCHIEKWIFPYLSYTGTEHPESMVFGMILNTEGFLGLIVVFLAWRYYKHMGQTGCLTTMCLIFGFLSCFGTIIVGNFQVSKAKVLHYIGAGLAFIIGTAFSVTSSISSRRTFKLFKPPLKYSKFIGALRLVIAFVMVFALTLVSGVGMYKKLSSRNRTLEMIGNMSLVMPNGSCRDLLSRIPPYVRYIDLVGSTTEWLLTGCMLFCLSLYAYEFKTFQNVKVVLKNRNGLLTCDESPKNCNRKDSSPSQDEVLISPASPTTKLISLQPLNPSDVSTTVGLRSDVRFPRHDGSTNNLKTNVPLDIKSKDDAQDYSSNCCAPQTLTPNNNLNLPTTVNISQAKSLPNLSVQAVV